MTAERVQKILARAGVASRRKAEELITAGRVTVNGKIATLGERADATADAIKVDGKRVQPASGPHHYLLLNKPKGVMTTVSDPQGRPTVIDFVPPKFRKALVPVGRLDFQTEGLLLLTDDGEFAEHLSHPRYGSRKKYLVKVSGTPDSEALDKLRAGIVLDGHRTSPCVIEPARPNRPRGGGRDSEGESAWFSVELFEGRTRQIREMFQRVGAPVQKLRRVAIGPLEDPALPLGAVRELTEREVERLRRVTSSVKPRRTTAPKTPKTPKTPRRPARKPRR